MEIAYIVLKGMPLGGGIEKYTEEVGSRLVQKGHRVTVYTMRHYGVETGFYKGMRIKAIPTLRSKSLEKITASFIAAIRHCIEDRKTDIVHYHAFGPSMFCFIPRLVGKKTVVQGHGIEWKRSRWNLVGRLFLRLTEIPSVVFPHKLTVVSQVQKEYIKNKYGRESVYIPTGVNPPIILQPNLIKKKYGLYGKDYILFAARLVKEKGAHYLIDAFNQINTDLKLVIAGDAKHEDEYKNYLKRLAGENKKIIFTGFVTGELLYELFSNAYLFVLPSEIEGLPTALLEAMSYGNCCLASNIEENQEAINGFGYTFKNKDVSSLKDMLVYLIQNKDKVDAIREPAERYVLENFTWDLIAERFEKLYSELLGGVDE